MRSSHERWDGGGYPDGLAGDEIPLGARDRLRLRRVRRDDHGPPVPARVPEQTALSELASCAGSQFDPNVVDAFARALRALRPDRACTTAA